MGKNGAFWGTSAQTLMAQAGRTFYTGNFRHNLDDKARLTIPSAWRSAHEEADAFLAVPNPAGYVSVLPPAEVAKLYEKIASVPMADAEAQAEIDAFFAVSQTFSFDKQGRVALSAGLLSHAGITKEAVLVGSLTKFNIYNPEFWARQEQKAAAAGAAGFLRRYQI